VTIITAMMILLRECTDQGQVLDYNVLQLSHILQPHPELAAGLYLQVSSKGQGEQ
jgi:hypothetical protein